MTMRTILQTSGFGHQNPSLNQSLSPSNLRKKTPPQVKEMIQLMAQVKEQKVKEQRVTELRERETTRMKA